MHETELERLGANGFGAQAGSDSGDMIESNELAGNNRCLKRIGTMSLDGNNGDWRERQQMREISRSAERKKKRKGMTCLDK